MYVLTLMALSLYRTRLHDETSRIQRRLNETIALVPSDANEWEALPIETQGRACEFWSTACNQPSALRNYRVLSGDSCDAVHSTIDSLNSARFAQIGGADGPYRAGDGRARCHWALYGAGICVELTVWEPGQFQIAESEKSSSRCRTSL